ncbi:MAG TPA: ribbon-helix-helix protein, CopG family [Kofleriaceae bacterium]|nr:ribbon-helix-helix protein, CopG family [Kofleriaceae bacterium]
MERLNLTLDEGTSGALARHAKREGKPRAALARELIREAIARREALQAQRKLARDYAAGRSDARQILRDLERAQIELLDEDDAG